ncbi:hypothetical protein SAMN05216350_104222 [Polaromonas sp. YR568]|uniref:hypothetical protein n=1 Tax=Polaromonas sp. YR568 TaxID=1855301 RepID=UPI0008F1ED49|nr:hypothetical protein [Polaromonas sp. YR568]SFU73147.1 hypothetical protein SAMN05216350_104222 [Polaromonas sp. YR568]
MFIVWGKKAVYKKLGFVADFCTICRCAQPFLVRRIGMAGHVYYITVGEGELVGYDRTCQACGTSYTADAARYQSMAKKQAPLAELMRKTFPGFAAYWADRLSLEEKVKSSPMLLAAEERKSLLREAFLVLSPSVEKRFASTHMDKEVGFAVLATIGLLLAVPALTRVVAPDQAEVAVLVAMAAGIVLVIWQIAVSGRRFMRRDVVPLLAKSLNPLRPKKEEVTAILAELKTHGHKIGSKLKVADLLDGLKPARVVLAA